MKRIKIAAVCAAALMVLCLGALAGCGPNDEEVIRNGVAEELDGLKNLDEAALADLMSGADVADLSEFGIDANEFMKAYLAGFDYRIDDVTVDGKEAHVDVALTCKSYAAYERALEDAAAKLAEDESFLELPEAEMNQKIGETVMEATAAIEPVDAGSVTIDYTLEGSTWTPTEQSTRNIAEVLFG